MPVIMYFIMANVLILYGVLSLVAYQVFTRLLLPAILRSRPAKLFKRRVSLLIRRLFFDMRDDFLAHFMTLFETDRDERDFEPYVESPVKSVPPCETVRSPPKEEPNNNSGNPPSVPAPRRGVRGRARSAPWGRGNGQPAIRLPAVIPGGPIQVGPGIEAPPNSPPVVPPHGRNFEIRAMLDFYLR